MLRKPLAKLLRDRRGSAVVETAVVLPLMLMLLFGMIELGRALQHHHTLTKSVRDAARYIARVPLDCPATADGNWGAVRAAAQNLALTGQITGGTPIYGYWTAGAFTVADPACDALMGRPIQLITVTGEVTYQDLGLLGFLQLPPATLSAVHQEVHIGE